MGTAVTVWRDLGSHLERDDRLSEAGLAYRHALSLNPHHLEALVGVARVHMALNEPVEAIRFLERALAVDPAHPQAHQRLGWAYALAGDLRRNWEEIAWFDNRGGGRFQEPGWNGGSLEGKTILLWTNAALGDTIQLVRFAKDVKALGARVVIECHPMLASLLGRLKYIDNVVPRGAPLPSFNVHALLASLPRVFRINWADIPYRTSYLAVPDDLVVSWRRRLAPSKERLIGIVWAPARRPDSRPRTSSLADFGRLATVRDVRLISLQFGSHAAELRAPPEGFHVEEYLTDTTTAEDTAAIICNLDLVISVDTMVAHLAGALGKTIWTVLPLAADWRWGWSGDSTPWYQSMRLFRQQRRTDWRGVFDRICQRLSEASA